MASQPYPGYTDPQDPTGELIWFLERVFELLQKIVDARDLLIAEDMRDPIYRAWNELLTKRGAILSAIRNSKVNLENAGLSGDQLTMKLTGFWRAWQAFNKLVGGKRLKRLLDWINKLLGSIALTFPLVEALKELKEAIEAELEESSS